jgi:hypothetical protein
MSDEVKTKGFAVVALEIEVDFEQPWSGDEKMSEVYRVAAREVVDKLHGMADAFARQGIRLRITSAPKVRSVIVPEKT